MTVPQHAVPQHAELAPAQVLPSQIDHPYKQEGIVLKAGKPHFLGLEAVEMSGRASHYRWYQAWAAWVLGGKQLHSYGTVGTSASRKADDDGGFAQCCHRVPKRGTLSLQTHRGRGDAECSILFRVALGNQTVPR